MINGYKDVKHNGKKESGTSSLLPPQNARSSFRITPTLCMVLFAVCMCVSESVTITGGEEHWWWPKNRNQPDSDKQNNYPKLFPILNEYSQVSPQRLTVTKPSSRTGTSTVRSWPSHNFFRSVLSRSDNIAEGRRERKRKNGSKSTRHATGLHSRINSNVEHTLKEFTQQNAFGYFNSQNTPKKDANKKKKKKEKVGSLESRMGKQPMKLQVISTQKDDTYSRKFDPAGNKSMKYKARSGGMASSTKDENLDDTPPKKLHEPFLNTENIKTKRRMNYFSRLPKYLNKSDRENDSLFIQPINSSAELGKRNDNDYSHILTVNSPQFGFQYRIVVPPSFSETTSKPSGSNKHSSVNVPISQEPPTPIALSTATHAEELNNSDESGTSYKNSRNTSVSPNTSAVTLSKSANRVTDDAPSTSSARLPSLLQSQSQTKKGSSGALNTNVPSMMYYNIKRKNGMILRNPGELQVNPPPTHTAAQLNNIMPLDSSNVVGHRNDSRIHLPHSLAAYPKNANTKIKTNDPWTINHKFGNVDSSSTDNAFSKTTFTAITASPAASNSNNTSFPSNLTGYRVLNSSSDNTLATFTSHFRVTTTAEPATLSWKFRPTQSFLIPSRIQIPSGEKPKHTFDTEIAEWGINQFLQNSTYKAPFNYLSHHHENRKPDSKANASRVQKFDRADDGSKNGSTVILKRKNMFTVVNKAKTIPRIHIESNNKTLAMKKLKVTEIKRGNTPKGDLVDPTGNQLERPFVDKFNIQLSMSIPGEEINIKNDNDYFDEDDSQSGLHHWIESEQGHFVTPSTELPMFTNLTWPYYISSPEAPADNNAASPGNSTGVDESDNEGKSDAPTTAFPATALSVSFANSQQRKQSTQGFNSLYEFYIPSASADPLQNPILVAKKQYNKTAESTSTQSWMPVSTIQLSTLSQQVEKGTGTIASGAHKLKDMSTSHLKQSSHKSKIKHTHWGSNGLSTKPQNSHQVRPSPSHLQKQQSSTIKVYENVTSNPNRKTTSVSPLFAHFTNPYKTTDTSQSTKKYQQHIITSPTSATFGNIWPFGFGEGVTGQSETVSFATAKTPTNIWYKPIINHFTASVPLNGTAVLYDNFHNENIFSDVDAQRPIPTTSMFPPTLKVENSVGGEEMSETLLLPNNQAQTFQGQSTFITVTSNDLSATPIAIPNQKDHGSVESPILFKVWGFVDGKLKLQNQREIPVWALQGYIVPENGTILNLQRIPPALQPLVTSAIRANEEAEVGGSNIKPYIWKPLPMLNRFGSTVGGTSNSAATKVVITTAAPYESLFDGTSNQIKITSGNPEWAVYGGGAHHQIQSAPTKSTRPISINYVLWNNDAPIYDHSIILTTPTPLLQVSRRPTPVSYFPSSPITQTENTTPAMYQGMYQGITSGGSKPDIITSTTDDALNVHREKLEMMFQNYFQHLLTTSTPATTTTTELPIIPVVKVEDANDSWNDLKELLADLAAGHNNKGINKRTGIPLDKQTGNPDFLGNVAAIALIMSYLRDQREGAFTSPVTLTQHYPSITSTTKSPYGVTNDMTPPHKDQLWATVYPLFQHYLNNRDYVFIPPPSPPPPPTKPHNLPPLPPELSALLTPTSPGPIPFTEPQYSESSAPASGYYTRFNHYASYYPEPSSSTPRSSSVYHISITEAPYHGATTTQQIPHSENKLGEVEDSELYETSLSDKKTKSLLLLKKLKKKKHKFKKKKHKVKHKIASAIVGASLLKKISKPFMHVIKKPSKYWLDLKFDVDFYQLIKKQLLYFLAVRYMPVAMILAYGVLPFALSLVPLLYKMWLARTLKPHTKHVKIPIPYPSLYPVSLFKKDYPPKPPPHFDYGFQDHYSPGNEEHFPLHQDHSTTEFPSDVHYMSHFNAAEPPPMSHFDEQPQPPSVTHVDSPPYSMSHYYDEPPFPVMPDHHYAADTTGNHRRKNLLKYLFRKPRRRGHGHGLKHRMNSFNDGNVDPYSISPHHHNIQTQLLPPNPPHSSPEKDQEIHVHIHDDEPQYQLSSPVVTQPPVVTYTSFTREDLQPYPTTSSYEVGFDFGQKLAGITNKHDMEILKILLENKKHKISQLIDMWNLAKYGAAVASETAANAVRGRGVMRAPTPAMSYEEQGPIRKRRRKKRRRKRKPGVSERSNVEIRNYG